MSLIDKEQFRLIRHKSLEIMIPDVSEIKYKLKIF